jgi:hypothetical protein
MAEKQCNSCVKLTLLAPLTVGYLTSPVVDESAILAMDVCWLCVARFVESDKGDSTAAARLLATADQSVWLVRDEGDN